MKLSRPLVFFDIESTGTNPETDRIVELAMVKLQPSGERIAWRYLVNPCVPIPASATAIHHITNEHVADQRFFVDIANQVASFLDGCDLAGYNILGFDLPMLEAEFARVGVPFNADDRALVDAMKLFHRKEPRDLAGAMKFYLARELEGAHGAMADTKATVEVLEAQVQRYGFQGDAAELAKLCLDPDAVDRDGKFKRVEGEIVFAFGKCNGQRLSEVARRDRGYLQWMLGGNFGKSTKKVITQALDGLVAAARRDSASISSVAAMEQRVAEAQGDGPIHHGCDGDAS